MKIIKKLSRSQAFGTFLAATFSLYTLGPSLALALDADGAKVDLGAPNANAEKRFLLKQNRLIGKGVSDIVKNLFDRATKLHDEVSTARDQAQFEVMLQVAGNINQLASGFSGNSPFSAVGNDVVQEQALPALLAAAQAYPTAGALPDFPGLAEFQQLANLGGALGQAAGTLGQQFQADLQSLPTGNIDPIAATAKIDGLISKYSGFLSSSQTQLNQTTAQITDIQNQISSVTGQIAAAETQLSDLTSQLATSQAQLSSLQSALATAQAAVPPDQALIDSLTSQIAGVNSTVTGLQSSISSVTSQINSLQNTMSGLTSQLSSLQNVADNLGRLHVPFNTGALSQLNALKGLMGGATDLYNLNLGGMLGGINIDIGIIRGIGGNLEWAFDQFRNYYDGAMRYVNGIQDQILKFKSNEIYQLAKKWGPLIIKILKDPKVLGSMVMGFVKGIAKEIVNMVVSAIKGILPGWVRALIPGLATAPATYQLASASNVVAYAPLCRGAKNSTKRIKCEAKRAAKWKKFKAGYTHFRRDAILQLPEAITEISRDEVSGESLADALTRIESEFRSNGLVAP